MKIYPLETVVAVARARSPFYREFYSQAPQNPERLSDLPIIDQKAFWDANTAADNKLLTAPMHDGIVFKSGGTSGDPKFSIYDKTEWQSFVEAFGRGIAADGLQDGDRVANLFFAGELYASFVFITESLQCAPVECLQFPLAGTPNMALVAETLLHYEINVIAGLPVTINALADHIDKEGIEGIHIDRILFGGENMYQDQRQYLSRVFPDARVSSIGYASVDAGLLGYCDLSCEPSEHRRFGRETILEIVDEETGEPIEEAGRPGRVIITNLTRLLMPVIRYPAGDRAEWVEPAGPPDRKFRILGRSEEGARVGPMTLYVEDVHHVLDQVAGEFELADFQMVVTHTEHKDRMTLRIACHRKPSDPDQTARKVQTAIYEARPMFAELLENDVVHPLAVEWVEASGLETNPRSGKLRRVIDRRA